MRRSLSIPAILLVLVLGAELCGPLGSPVIKEPSPLQCILDDDHAEEKQGLQRHDASPAFNDLTLSAMHLIIQSRQTGLVLSQAGADFATPGSAKVRLHRRLCRECC